ncbi:unnamed protein product, partial [Angiostrongylus costaricensis]|uniref:Arginine and glutamate-rich protein 1 n=1 Tax=Angiostrongylus costaricensis TaxID=334426 RepID=A0A0R3Q1H4_ANGCS
HWYDDCTHILSFRPIISSEVERELTGTFDISSISTEAREWLEERIAEQVLERVKKLEEAMTESQKRARAEVESRLRAQILGEMEEEMASIRRREEASRAKCSALEKELEEKVRQADESEKRFNEERLAMLAERSALERERQEVLREKTALQKHEQLAIINKGGAVRPPIKFSFGK